MTGQSRDTKALQVCIDANGPSEFGIAVDGKFIKYLTIDHGLYNVSNMCFTPPLISIFPYLPCGDWNEGHVAINNKNGQPYFAKVIKRQFAQISARWHLLQVDYWDLRMGRKLRTNVYEATHPHLFNSEPIIVKFARFAWEIPQLDAETSAYQWIDGHDIGPKFLGHLSEEGRIIGFLLERITNARHATPEDLPACQVALSRLHAFGIKHEDINKHKFLIRDDGRATLIDFDNATRCGDREVLGEEMRRSEGELRDMSGRGGMTVMGEGGA